MNVYEYNGPYPPANDSIEGARIELNCPRCGYTPLVNDAHLRALIHVAAQRGGRADIYRPTA